MRDVRTTGALGRNVRAILLTTSVAIVAAGCGDNPRVSGGGLASDDLTNGEVCRELGEVGCDWAAACGYEGSRSQCVSDSVADCCTGESCEWPAAGDEEQLAACKTAVRTADCDGEESHPACEGLLGDGPGSDDAGSGGSNDGTIVLDAGSGSGDDTRHEECFDDYDCGDDAEGCFEVQGESSSYDLEWLCTSRCDGAGDTEHCRADEMCITQSGDRPAVCYKRCDGDTDCPRHLLCRDLYAGQVCAP